MSLDIYTFAVIMPLDNFKFGWNSLVKTSKHQNLYSEISEKRIKERRNKPKAHS